jgi:hypothetical protein
VKGVWVEKMIRNILAKWLNGELGYRYRIMLLKAKETLDITEKVPRRVGSRSMNKEAAPAVKHQFLHMILIWWLPI